jgi:hypothetical protein
MGGAMGITMTKLTTDDTTVLFLTGDEVKTICHVGQGHICCPYVVVGGNGFECWRMNYPSNGFIVDRIYHGTMNAKGPACNDKKWSEFSDAATEIEATI